jgi:transglutaminase-like putative cysteine protease
MTRRRLLAFACFLALAAVAALIVSRVADPAVPGLLVPIAVLAACAGGAGALNRRLWPVALLALPLGAYLVARLQIGLPEPTPGVQAHLAFYAGRIADGAAAYARQTFPLDTGSPDLRLLLSLAVYAVVGVAAFVALSLRRPLPAVVLLLCLAGFGFTIDRTEREPWAALAFIVLSGALLALTHPLPRERVRLADAVAGGATATIAAVLALSVLGATTVEAGRPLQDWRTWDLAGPGNALMRYDWMQNYPQLLTRNGDAVVMEVRSPVASYWRANVLTEFTGSVWRSGLATKSLWPKSIQDGWSYPVPRTDDRGIQGRLVTQRFDVRATYTDHLFVGGWASEVRTRLLLDLGASSAATVSVTPARGPATSYEVRAFVPDLGPTDLIGKGRTYPRELAATYLQLPFPAIARAPGDTGDPMTDEQWLSTLTTPALREWDPLYRLNQIVVGDEADPFRTALAIESYLRGPSFQYTLHPPASEYTSPYAAFLFDTHAGYCQHFAGAMAVLLRYNGIPARVVVGFTQGDERRQGVFTVRRDDAHAWVEAYFPGAGWAQFDPTPGRRLPAPPSEAGAAGAAGAGAGGAGADSSGRTGADRPGRARVNDPGGLDGLTGTRTLAAPARWLWALALVAALLGWPAGRALLRRRGLLASSTDARLRASAGLLYGTLRDHGVDVPSSQTLEETAQLLRTRYRVDAGDVPARMQAVAFGGREATEEDVAALRALRRRVAAGLRAHESRFARVAALYGLRRRRPALPAGTASGRGSSARSRGASTSRA